LIFLAKEISPKKVKNDPALRMINNVGTIYSAIGTPFFEVLAFQKLRLRTVFVLKRTV
jgi:hypothetical protein